MITLKTNIYSFITRIFTLFICFLAEYVMTKFGVKSPESQNVFFKIDAIHLHLKLLYFVYFTITVIAYIILQNISSLLGVSKIYIDTNTNEITFVKLFFNETISITDISEFFEQSVPIGSKTIYGILINLNDSRSIQLSEKNIRNLSTFAAYLNEKNIPFSGERKMKFPFP